MPRFFRQPPISATSCREVVELVTAYLEGTLDARAARRVDVHLARCEGCRIYLEQIRNTVATLASAELPGLPVEVCADLVEAFRNWHVQEQR